MVDVLCSLFAGTENSIRSISHPLLLCAICGFMCNMCSDRHILFSCDCVCVSILLWKSKIDLPVGIIKVHCIVSYRNVSYCNSLVFSL